MKTMFQWMVAVGCGLLILQIAVHAFPEMLCLLLLFPLAIAFIVLVAIAAIIGCLKWRRGVPMRPIPPLVFLVLLAVGLWQGDAIGRSISNWYFGRHLDAYARVVNDFRNGTSSCQTTCNAKMETLDVKDPPALVGAIWGAHCDDGGVIVLFLGNWDVILMHEGYFFKDYASTSNCETHHVSPELGWPQVPYVRQINGHWYHFADQPGL